MWKTKFRGVIPISSRVRFAQLFLLMVPVDLNSPKEEKAGRNGAGSRRERPIFRFAPGYTNGEGTFLGCVRGRCRARSAQRRAPSRPFAQRRPKKQELAETEPAAAACSLFSEILSSITFCDGRRIGHTVRGPELGRRRGAANYPHVRTHARASCG